MRIALVDYIFLINFTTSLSGLFYGVELSKGGLELSFQGYNHKLAVLVSKTLDETFKLGSDGSNCSVDMFERVKEKLLQNYKNYLFWQPYYHCIYGSLVCLEDPRWSSAEKYNALKGVDVRTFLCFAAAFLKSLKAEVSFLIMLHQNDVSQVFVHGNMSKSEASDISDLIKEKLRFLPLDNSQEPVRRVVDVTPGCEYVYRQHSKNNNPNEVNNSIENIYFISRLAGLESTDDSSSGDHKIDHMSSLAEKFGSKLVFEALVELLAHMMSEPAFDQLRTKEQLGYIVFTGVKKVITIAHHFINNDLVSNI